MNSPFKILSNGDNKLIDDQRVNPPFKAVSRSDNKNACNCCMNSPFKAVSCSDNKLVGDEAAATVKLLTKLNS